MTGFFPVSQVIMSRYHNHFRQRASFLDLFNMINPKAIREMVIKKNIGEWRFFLNDIVCFRQAGCEKRPEIPLLQYVTQQETDIRFIINDKYSGGLK